MGRLNRLNVHTRELNDNDWALPELKNQAFYQSGYGNAGNDFFNMPAASPTGQVVNDITAMRVAAVYSCVERISVIATLPKHIYKNVNGERQRVDHPLWNLLNTEACDTWTAASFWERQISSMLLRGDGLAEIVRNNRYFTDNITQIRPLYRETVFISMENGRLKYRITTLNGESYVKDQDDILHFSGFGFNGFRGMSVIQFAARNGVGVALAADGFAAEFFGNGQRPDYLLTTDGTLTKEQSIATREALEEQHRGMGNRHKPLVLQGGLKLTPLSMPPGDTQLLETRKFEVVDIAMAFGVPPQLIGAQDSTAGWAGSSLEQLNLGFLKYTLRAHISRMTQEINRKLFKNTDYFCEFNLEAFLEGDTAAQTAHFSAAIGGTRQQGFMTVNEVRKLKNLPPDESAGGKYNHIIEAGTTTTTTDNIGSQP